MFPKPAEYFHSNFYSKVDSSLCVGCEACVETCNMEAMSLENGSAVVDYDRCIGCGVCVSQCQSDAISLERKQQEYVPPKNHNAMYQKILLEKVGIMGILKMMPQAVLGKKI